MRPPLTVRSTVPTGLVKNVAGGGIRPAVLKLTGATAMASGAAVVT